MDWVGEPSRRRWSEVETDDLRQG